MIGAGLRAQAHLLLGRQPRRRLAAPLPRRRRARLAAPARARGAQPRRAWPTATSPARPGLPFAVLRGYVGTDLPERTADTIKPITCPFTGEALDRGAGAQPRRRRSSTPSGPTGPATCRCGASSACRRRPCSPPGAVAGHRRGDRRRARAACPARSCCRPGRSTAVAAAPGGAHPSYAHGYSTRDNDFYRAWDAISARPRHVQRLARAHVLERPERRSQATSDARDAVHRRRDDDRRRRAARCATARSASSASACPAPPPTSPAAPTRPDLVLDLRVRHASARSPTRAAAVHRRRRARRRPPTRSSACPRCSTTGSSRGRIDVGFLGAAQIDRFAQHQHHRHRRLRPARRSGCPAPAAPPRSRPRAAR